MLEQIVDHNGKTAYVKYGGEPLQLGDTVMLEDGCYTLALEPRSRVINGVKVTVHPVLLNSGGYVAITETHPQHTPSE